VAGFSERFAEDLVFAYYRFPREQWRRIRTNSPMERAIREVRRSTVVSPDGQSALMLLGARLRHMAGSKWGTRRCYLDMQLFRDLVEKINVAS
jgi:hypothetical protein